MFLRVFDQLFLENINACVTVHYVRRVERHNVCVFPGCRNSNILLEVPTDCHFVQIFAPL